MKKTKIFVLAVAITLGFSFKVGAFPASKEVLIIGSKAYDLNSNGSMIISSRFTDSDFLNYLANNTEKIYYLVTDSDGNATTLKDVFGGGSTTEANLINKIGGRITYYSGTNTTATDHWVSENGKYKDSTEQNSSTSSNQYVTFQIEPKQVVGDLYIFNFKVNNLVGVPGGEYFSVGSSNIGKITDTATCMVDVSTIKSGTTLPIYMYSSDMKTKIASATLQLSDISDSLGNIITSATIKTIKFNNVTNIITSAESKYTVLGNISNGGFLDSDDNYIYYVNTGDSNKIYKKNSHGTVNNPITNDNAGYIYVYGSWIYYCNYSDGGKIYKVKTDGTRRQKVSNNKGTYLNVIDDKVYYVNASDAGKIYCLDSAGNSTKLTDDVAAFLNIGTSHNLFYSNKSEANNLYEIDTSGNRSKVDDLGTSNSANYINISTNSTVAYYSSSNGNVYRSGDPYNKIRIKIQTTNGLVDDKISNINISNSTIYYKSLTDKGRLYMVGTNGGVAQKLCNDTVDGIFVYANDISGTDDVYYTKSGKLYMIPSDGVLSGTVQKGTAVSKPKITTKISSIDSIGIIYTNNSDSAKTIENIDVLKYLPDTVTTIMSDGSIQQLPVSWDTTIPKSKNGIYNYTGTIVGYGNKVTAPLAVGAETGMSTDNAYASNETGKNDTVVVEAGTLTIGDIVKVYDPANDTKVLKTGIVDATGGVVISGLNFGIYAGTVKITVTKSGKAESQGIYLPYGPERSEAPIIADYDLEDTELTADGEYITISGIRLKLTGTEQIYIGSKKDSAQATSDEGNWISVTNPGVYGYWDSSSKILTLNGSNVTKVLATDLQSSGKSLFIRKAGNPASSAAVFVINPRIPVPYSVTFDEYDGIIRGTTIKQEYSLDGGTTWKDCSAGTTYVGAFPTASARVRIKATKSTLASLEALQIKLTDLEGENKNLAITKPATVNSSNGDITNGTVTLNSSTGNATGSTLNTIVLKSSVATTWKVINVDGSSTSIASIKSVGKDSKTALLTGYENGVVKVIATTTDGNNMQGEINVNITNQPVITVKTSEEFKNAVNSGARVIKLLGIGGSYYFNTLPTPNNTTKDLTIIGQDQTSVINITNTSGGAFATVNGYNLNLKNLTVKGAASSSISNIIKVTSGSVNIDGVYFDSIKSNNNDAIGIQHTDGTLIVNNSKFLVSNLFVNAIKTTDGTITNNSFVGNSSFAEELGAVYASDAATIQGNTITNYLGNTGEYAISVKDSSAVIGGVAKDLWNVINNSIIGIKLNGSGISTSDLQTNNSIDIKNTTTPIEE